MNYRQYVLFEYLMLFFHLLAIFVLFRWEMFITLGIARLPRIFTALIIGLSIRKKDVVTQGKWHLCESRMRLVTVILHGISAFSVQAYIMLNQFCNLYLYEQDRSQCYELYTIVMSSIILLYTIFDVIVQLLHDRIVLDFSEVDINAQHQADQAKAPREQELQNVQNVDKMQVAKDKLKQGWSWFSASSAQKRYASQQGNTRAKNYEVPAEALDAQGEQEGQYYQDQQQQDYAPDQNYNQNDYYQGQNNNDQNQYDQNQHQQQYAEHYDQPRASDPKPKRKPLPPRKNQNELPIEAYMEGTAQAYLAQMVAYDKNQIYDYQEAYKSAPDPATGYYDYDQYNNNNTPAQQDAGYQQEQYGAQNQHQDYDYTTEQQNQYQGHDQQNYQDQYNGDQHYQQQDYQEHYYDNNAGQDYYQDNQQQYVEHAPAQLENPKNANKQKQDQKVRNKNDRPPPMIEDLGDPFAV